MPIQARDDTITSAQCFSHGRVCFIYQERKVMVINLLGRWMLLFQETRRCSTLWNEQKTKGNLNRSYM